ncbi:MAG: DUF4340 domain-containing protein [Woeseia sp.]
MSARQIKTLAIVLLVLVATLVAINVSEDQGDTSINGQLFPQLKGQLNSISEVSITRAGESITVKNNSGQWVVAERDDYPADTGKLRKLLLALADASRLEEKTSNPDMYPRLGVEDMKETSEGVEIRISGAEAPVSLIIGKLAQRKYRYARVSGQATSWLINQNPVVPADAGDWLLPEILDIDASRVRSVTITHDDGETIHLQKEDAEDNNFSVPDMPDRRELRYPSIVNGIAGVVSNLNLEDVSRASASVGDGSNAKTVFTMFDGLQLTVESFARDENTWIRLTASQDDADSSEAAEINARTSGWEYQLQSYKGDQLRRRWNDILKENE